MIKTQWTMAFNLYQFEVDSAGLTLVLAIHVPTRLISIGRLENLSFLASHIISITILAVLLDMVGVSLRLGGFS